MRELRFRFAVLSLAIATISSGCAHQVQSNQAQALPAKVSHVREYWFAVVSEPWDITPNSKEISAKYTALHIHAYTPDFKSRLPDDPELGLAGPIIDADVGDEVIVHFKNLDTHYKLAHSMHVHGLHYTSDMDGAYSEMDKSKAGAAVKLGETFTYHYQAVSDSVGVWPYHDHSIDEGLSVSLGAFGPIRVRQPDAKEPKPDREYFLFMSALDKSTTKLNHDYDVFNGYAYMANTPRLHAKRGELVRFNTIGLGTEFHTFHIHGYRWNDNGVSQDVHMVGPATSWSVQFRANNVGHWMYHCHVQEHMANGMMGMFIVED